MSVGTGEEQQLFEKWGLGGEGRGNPIIALFNQEAVNKLILENIPETSVTVEDRKEAKKKKKHCAKFDLAALQAIPLAIPRGLGGGDWARTARRSLPFVPLAWSLIKPQERMAS